VRRQNAMTTTRGALPPALLPRAQHARDGMTLRPLTTN
jgi:hypothetical protein